MPVPVPVRVPVPRAVSRLLDLLFLLRFFRVVRVRVPVTAVRMAAAAPVRVTVPNAAVACSGDRRTG